MSGLWKFIKDYEAYGLKKHGLTRSHCISAVRMLSGLSSFLDVVAIGDQGYLEWF